MNKKKKYIIMFINFTIVILFSTLILASRPGYSEICAHKQTSIFYKIMNYSEDNYHDKIILPGKQFEDLYNKLLKENVFDKPISYPTKDCSYGITLVSGEPMIYCKYHGNKENALAFNSINSSIYFANRDSTYLFIFFVCSILAVIIGLFKNIIKKINKA